MCYNNTVGQPDGTTPGEYCWCKATRFVSNDNVSHDISQKTVWVYDILASYSSASACKQNCSEGCAITMRSGTANSYDNYDIFRESVFGELKKQQ